MADAPGPSLQNVTDGRLTLKQPHRDYLGQPTSVDISMGPGNSILIHNRDRRRQLIAEIIGGTQGGPLDSDQNQVELRLDSMCQTCPVDEQGRVRLPEVLLELAGLTDKSSKAYIIPRSNNGWLEVWPQSEFKEFFRHPVDEWMEALNRLIQRRREERGPDTGAGSA